MDEARVPNDEGAVRREGRKCGAGRNAKRGRAHAAKRHGHGGQEGDGSQAPEPDRHEPALAHLIRSHDREDE